MFSSKKKGDIVSLFKERNLFYQSNALEELSQTQFLQKVKGKAVYCGYDPTASSLHIGNLISILMLARLNMLGLKPIFLVGGATGLIGDPSGKSRQRQLLQQETVQNNIVSIEKQIEKIYRNVKTRVLDNQQKYDLSHQYVENLKVFNHQIVNNARFYEQITFVDFLRKVGKNFRMGPLLARQMVAKRLQSEQGISFAQFTYSLIQGYDFCQLFMKKDCILQIGGSDQWGNILNGTDLIKKQFNAQSYAITMPLLLAKSGTKFGKSEGNALYLNVEKTSLKEIYQYFYNTADEDLQKYLKIFTFFSEKQIKEIIQKHEKQKQRRAGQTILSEQVVNILGNYSHVDKQFFTLSQAQLKEKPKEYLAAIIQQKKHSDPQSVVCLNRKDIQSFREWADVFVKTNLIKTKNQCRRKIEAGGIYINNQRLQKNKQKSPTSQNQSSNIFSVEFQQKLLYGKYMILRKGKKQYKFLDFFK